MKKILTILLLFLGLFSNAQINQYIQVQAVSDGIDTIGEFTVRFIDFDGTILKTELVDSFETAIAPEIPTHEFLTFDEWNNRLDSIQSDIDIGATYETTDGHTYLFITLNSYTDDDPVIYLNKSTTDSLYIIDNETDVILGRNGSSGNINISLSGQFAAYGDYVLRIECVGRYSFGNSSNTTQIFKNATYRYCLMNAYIGDSVSTLSNYSFYQCYSLTNVVIPKGVTSIGTNCFQSCNYLNFIVIPNGAVSIGNSCFNGCAALKSISIASTSTTIGTTCFSGCYSLSSIIIPNGITSLGVSFLYGCYSLVLFKIPSTVESLGTSCFQNCYSIKSITIPDGITSIGTSCFLNNYKIINIIINATTPPTLVNISAFTGLNLIAKIKVPAASVAAYQSATNWSDASIVNHIVSQ